MNAVLGRGVIDASSTSHILLSLCSIPRFGPRLNPLVEIGMLCFCLSNYLGTAPWRMNPKLSLQP